MCSLLRKRAYMTMCSFCLYPDTSLRWPVCADLIKSQDGAIQTKSFIHDVNQQVEMALGHSKFKIGSAGTFPVFTTANVFGRWWRQTGSNRRPEACKATALPTELCPQLAIIPDEAGFVPHRKPWWAWEDLNFRPHAYQARALTN
jgi:hypothetical protein